MNKKEQVVLAVDAGGKLGWALFREEKLVDYQNRSFSKRSTLKLYIRQLLIDFKVNKVIVEGGGLWADPWLNCANKLGIDCLQVYATDWRADILYKREQRSGKKAKFHAKKLAQDIIDQCEHPRPTKLHDDAAEAILLGTWWLEYGD